MNLTNISYVILHMWLNFYCRLYLYIFICVEKLIKQFKCETFNDMLKICKFQDEIKKNAPLCLKSPNLCLSY